MRSAVNASILLLTACVPADLRDQHASRVESYIPSAFSPADAQYTDPNRGLGPPDGRTVALDRSALLVLRFFRPIPNGPGPDLRVHELGEDGAQAKIGVSEEGTVFMEFEGFAEGLTSDFDLEALGLSQAAFVRVRGLDQAGVEPGFDLDALEALH
ncbi:MAG: hypothetical protein AAGD10_05635 [Myxococcota bacterium]